MVLLCKWEVSGDWRKYKSLNVNKFNTLTTFDCEIKNYNTQNHYHRPMTLNLLVKISFFLKSRNRE